MKIVLYFISMLHVILKKSVWNVSFPIAIKIVVVVYVKFFRVRKIFPTHVFAGFTIFSFYYFQNT